MLRVVPPTQASSCNAASRGPLEARFDILEAIGEGTYGKVYRATCKRTGRSFALKRLKADGRKGTGSGISMAAYREVKLATRLQRLRHQNLIGLHAVTLEQSSAGSAALCLLLELADDDLGSQLKRERARGVTALPLAAVRVVVQQCLDATAFLHRHWILHRDLSPANILVCGSLSKPSRLSVKLADFGLACSNLSAREDVRETEIVAKLWYRAPELLFGARARSASIDMWSLGCILAELMQMSVAFKGEEAGPGRVQAAQLRCVVCGLGPPGLEEWPQMASLPHWEQLREIAEGGDMRFEEQPAKAATLLRLARQAQRQKACRDAREATREASGDAAVSLPPKPILGADTTLHELLGGLLHYNPERRLKADEATAFMASLGDIQQATS